jgi:hypothetical protein
LILLQASKVGRHSRNPNPLSFVSYIIFVCETHFFNKQQQHGGEWCNNNPPQWAKKSKKTLWRHALGFLFWMQNFDLLVTSWVSLDLSIWNMQQQPLLCHPSSLKLHICIGHRQQLHLCMSSLWYTTVCTTVVAGTISNYHLYSNLSLSLLWIFQLLWCISPSRISLSQTPAVGFCRLSLSDFVTRISSLGFRRSDFVAVALAFPRHLGFRHCRLCTISLLGFRHCRSRRRRSRILLRILLSCGCCSWSLVGMWTEPG